MYAGKLNIDYRILNSVCIYVSTFFFGFFAVGWKRAWAQRPDGQVVVPGLRPNGQPARRNARNGRAPSGRLQQPLPGPALPGRKGAGCLETPRHPTVPHPHTHAPLCHRAGSHTGYVQTVRGKGRITRAVRCVRLDAQRHRYSGSGGERERVAVRSTGSRQTQRPHSHRAGSKTSRTQLIQVFRRFSVCPHVYFATQKI